MNAHPARQAGGPVASSFDAPRPSGNLTGAVGRARAAAATARRYRAEWLLGVAEGMVGPLDVVAHAATAEGRPLRRIRLSELLGTQPGWTPARVRRTLQGLLHQIDIYGTLPPEPKKITIGWVLDPRSDGRRINALVHSVNGREEPWAGFPYSRQPSAEGAVSGGFE